MWKCVCVCVGEVKIIARKSFLIKNYAWLVSNVRERWQKNENIMENSDKIALQVKSLKFSGENLSCQLEVCNQMQTTANWQIQAEYLLHNAVMKRWEGYQSRPEIFSIRVDVINFKRPLS